MEIYQVLEDKMIETFNQADVSKIKNKVKQLHRSIYINIWTRFKEILIDKYIDEDIKKRSKRGFFN